jgi:hypothetical protein
MTAVPAKLLYISPALPCARRKKTIRARARVLAIKAPTRLTCPALPARHAVLPPPARHVSAACFTPAPTPLRCEKRSGGRARNPGISRMAASAIAWMLHGCCMDAAWMLHECCMDVAWMLHGCRRDASRHAHAARRGRGAGAAAAPTGRALSPTLFSSLSHHTISISHLCERACGDVWRTRRICSGEFIRQGAPKSPQQPAQKQPARRSS